MITEPLSKAPEKCIGDALVNKDAEAPKSHFQSEEVRMLSSATGGLKPADMASTSTMGAIFPPPVFSWSLGEETLENRPDKFQPACPSLLEQGHTNEIKANSGV